MRSDFLQPLKEEQGVTAVMVAWLMVIFVGVAAFVIDISHLYMVRNELQNAADAGALAGARFLYDEEDGEDVEDEANKIAYKAAIANKSENNPVEVHWSGGNVGDVQRGHWSFATRTFTPNNNDDYTKIWNVSAEDLDANPNFINALRVRTRRQNRPVASFFAGFFGFGNFFLSAEAIAYVGFAGTLGPGEVSMPIAICRESLLVDGKYSCSLGRMMDMGAYASGQETGGWTDFNQDSPDGVNPSEVASLVSLRRNPDPILQGQPMGMTGGDIPTAFTRLRSRWKDVTDEEEPWRLTLPVIECPGNDFGSSAEVVGAVVINILWITGENDDPSYSKAPEEMEYPHSDDEWESEDENGQVRWNSFVRRFNIRSLDGSFAPYQKKTIYFVPDCHHQKPAGRTGGENFGIMAKIPALAK